MVDLETIGVPAFAVAVGTDGTFRYSAVNALNQARTGLSPATLVGRTPHDIFPAAVADRLCGLYRACVAQRDLIEYDVSADFPAGRSWWRATITPVLDAAGRVVALVGLCHEISSERRRTIALQAVNKHLDLAIRCLKGADWRFDVQSGRYSASDNLALLMGEAQPRPVAWSEWAERVVAEDLAGASCDSLLSGAAQEQVVRFRFRDSRNEIRWAQCRRIMSADDEQAPLICGVIVDVTDERRRELALEAEARRDSLTGLLNRRGFNRELQRLLAETDSPRMPLAILALDLDGFKAINDRFGHSVGDEVLIEVARRLTTTLGARAVTARLGGDEFVVACPVADRAEAGAMEQWLTEILRRPYRREGAWIRMSGSVGLSWRPQDIDLHAMLAEADERLYDRKRLRNTPRSVPLALVDADWGLDQMSLFAA